MRWSAGRRRSCHARWRLSSAIGKIRPSVMDQILHRYVGSNVPRYTSYPTAADFSSDVGTLDHAAWLGQISPSQEVSIYLHVPYCHDICFYCGCNTKMTHRVDVVAKYRQALETEIVMVGDLVKGTAPAARLHWGGGTPSMLGLHGLQSVIAVLRRHFPLRDAFEHAIELDPRYVTAKLADGLVRLGVTRASLGVQDVNPRVQSAIGRIQPLGTVEAAVNRLRSAGVQNLSFDLMYGLPLQTCESVRKTCASVLALAPNRISCFGYAHLPAHKANQRQIDQAVLPGQEQRFEQAEAIAEELSRAGYVKIGIDHFAKADDALAQAAAFGKLHRNFQGYTDDPCAILLGFGASSISTLANGYVQNISDVPRYVSAIRAGTLASMRGVRVTEPDRLRAAIIERLMCDFAVDLEQIAPGVDFSEELSMLRPMQRDGLIYVEGQKLSMTPRGRPVVRVAAVAFDAYRRKPSTQFSRAV